MTYTIYETIILIKSSDNPYFYTKYINVSSLLTRTTYYEEINEYTPSLK